MAGFGYACNRTVALLFKLETTVHLKQKESTAPASMLCLWKSCEKAAHLAPPLKPIYFSRVKTRKLPEDHSKNTSSTLKHYSTKNPFAGKFPLRHEQVQNLFNIITKAVFFSKE